MVVPHDPHGLVRLLVDGKEVLVLLVVAVGVKLLEKLLCGLLLLVGLLLTVLPDGNEQTHAQAARREHNGHDDDRGLRVVLVRKTLRLSSVLRLVVDVRRVGLWCGCGMNGV